MKRGDRSDSSDVCKTTTTTGGGNEGSRRTRVDRTETTTYRPGVASSHETGDGGRRIAEQLLAGDRHAAGAGEVDGTIDSASGRHKHGGNATALGRSHRVGQARGETR